jgi:hypothetical protein
MPRSSHTSIAKMQQEVHELLPSISRSQANVLGEMAYAMMMTDSCGMTRMCSYLSDLLGKPMNTLRQKYREMYYEKEAKAGVKKRQCKRRELVPEEVFADLLAGVLKEWKGEHTLVLALDASALTDRFTVLSISVVYRGCGMRVACTMPQGHQEGEWRPHWERMLKVLAQAVPQEWTVLVMADRGLYAPWLYRAIQANGWHPLLRVKKKLTFREREEPVWSSMGNRVKRTGRGWKGRGMWGEQGEQMEGTALVRWEKGYDEPICVVCDLPPKQAQAAWYQMRFWIEDEYKDGKRGWLHWEQTKMTKPERASRLWVILAIVLQKAILLGGRLEDEEEQARRRSRKRGGGPKRRRGRPFKPETRPRGREQSVLLRGMMAWRAAETGGKRVLPKGEMRAQPLPSRLYAVRRKPKRYQLKKQSREEKRRNQQRAQSKERKEQRAQVRAAQQAERQARRQEKQARREAKQAEQQARRQEKQTTLLAHQQGKKRTKRRPCVQQGFLGAPQGEAVLETQGHPTSSLGLLPAQSIQADVKHDLPAVEETTSLMSQGRSGELGETIAMSSKWQLRPPHRLVRKEIRQTGDHGPAQEASP